MYQRPTSGCPGDTLAKTLHRFAGQRKWPNNHHHPHGSLGYPDLPTPSEFVKKKSMQASEAARLSFQTVRFSGKRYNHIQGKFMKKPFLYTVLLVLPR